MPAPCCQSCSTYARLAPRLALQVGRYAHAIQFRRMRKALKRLKGYTGSVMRDLRRHLDYLPAGALRERVLDKLALVSHLLHQAPKGSDKIYALHEPIIDPCLAMALRKERLQPLHLLVRQPVKIAHHHPRKCEELNHAPTADSSKSMGPDPLPWTLPSVAVLQHPPPWHIDASTRSLSDRCIQLLLV